MAKKVLEEAKPEVDLALQQARAIRLPYLTSEQAEILMNALTKIGAKAEVLGIRSNAFDGGKTPFAKKVHVFGFTFITK